MKLVKINVKMLVALAVALVVLCSLVFAAVEAGHHDCTGEDCAICRQISACCDLLKNILLHTVPAIFAAAALCAAVSAAAVSAVDGAYTLVSLKLKLSD